MLFCSRPHGDLGDIAPLAEEFFIADEDGAVFSFLRGGGEWGFISIAGLGVGGEEVEAGAVAAVHFDAEALGGGAGASPAPVYKDLAAGDAEGEEGFEVVGIGRSLVVAEHAEGLGNVGVPAGAGAEPFHQRAKAGLDARQDGRGDGAGGCGVGEVDGGIRRIFVSDAGAIALGGGSLEGQVEGDLPLAEEVKNIGIERVGDDMGIGAGDLQGGEELGQGVAHVDDLGAEFAVVLFYVVLAGHRMWVGCELIFSRLQVE